MLSTKFFLFDFSASLQTIPQGNFQYIETLELLPKFGDQGENSYNWNDSESSLTSIFQVATLGKSIAIAGWLGSEKLPPVAQAAEEKTPEGNRFVSVPNAGAAALAQTPSE